MENNSWFWEFAVGLCSYERIGFMFGEWARAQVLFFSMIQKYQDASTSPWLLNSISQCNSFFTVRNLELKRDFCA